MPSDLDVRGMLGNRRIFLRIEDKDMCPDGPVVDSVGNIWISMFGGWGVYCYSPQGKLLEVIKLPVSNCTKVAFGGDDLKTMYVTTAWVGLSDEQRKQQPLAGGLFRLRVDVPGLVQHKFVVYVIEIYMDERIILVIFMRYRGRMDRNEPNRIARVAGRSSS